MSRCRHWQWLLESEESYYSTSSSSSYTTAITQQWSRAIHRGLNGAAQATGVLEARTRRPLACRSALPELLLLQTSRSRILHPPVSAKFFQSNYKRPSHTTHLTTARRNWKGSGCGSCLRLQVQRRRARVVLGQSQRVRRTGMRMMVS